MAKTKLALQAILDAAHDADDRPAAIKTTLTAEGVTPADIEQVLNESLEKFGQLNDSESVDADALHGLELLGDVIAGAREVQTETAAAAQALRDQRDQIAAKVLGEPSAPADAEQADSQDGTETAADETPAPEGDVAETVTDAPTDAVPEPVMASAKPARFNLDRIPSSTPKPDTTPTGVAITAAAGVRGVENGQSLDMDGLVAAVQARAAGMPRGRSAFVKDGVAQIKVAYPDELVASGKNDDQVLRYAADQTRLDGGSLTASGGWCAPSERLYELGDNLADAGAGLIDIPEIQVKRGGIITTKGVSFASVWAGNAGLVRTEEDEEDDPYVKKSLYRPTCPGESETRADVIYSGMVVGFLQNDAYPEVTKDAIAGVTAVHAHRINAETIERMVNDSTSVDLTGLGPSATGSILNGIGLLVMDARYRLRASESLLLDVVLPIWAKEIVRADYSLREGKPLEQVTDQVISGWIAARGGRIQWVYDWQDAYTGVSGGFGSPTAIEAYPATVDALVYPAGTFVRGRGEVVNLDMVYDSTMTVENDYLQMFMEEKLLVHKKAHFSQVATIGLGVNGATGTGLTLDANGKIAVVENGGSDDDEPIE